ncbi:hypothetical protein [Desulfoscipio gibsoniae]
MSTNQILIMNPRDIARLAYAGGVAECVEAAKKNKKRAALYLDPLPVPEIDVAQTVVRAKLITSETFTPQFKAWAKEHPWDGKSDAKSWERMAVKWLRDYYLVPLAKSEPGIFEQMCKIWPEMTPPPELTKEQLAKLGNLQQQADAAMEHLAVAKREAVDKLKQLAVREKAIVKPSRTPNRRKIENLLKWLEYRSCVEDWQEDTTGWGR